MRDEEIIEVLIEDIDEEILLRMPEWFRVLRNAWKRIRKLV